MTSNQYTYAWLIYLIGVAGCLFVWWHLTVQIKQNVVRKTLRFSALFTLITPVYLSPTHNFMAPALMSAIFDLLTYGFGSLIYNSAGRLVILSTIVGAGVALLTCTTKSALKNNTSHPTKKNRAKNHPIKQGT